MVRCSGWIVDRESDAVNWLPVIGLVLLIPALFLNLGVNPLFAVNDEAIRILVSQEMKLSGDYLTPTTFGEPYLNKPPLFNWLVMLSSELSGSYTEFSLRLVSVLSLLGFGLLVFHYASKQFTRPVAVFLAFALVTTGRILYFDSFLGLIDITHGMVVFWNFMLIYHLFHRRKFLGMFVVSYALTAAAFFLKGLPALVFQGITLSVFFWMEGRFRMLFSWRHAAGILVLLIPVVTYYFFYSLRNELSFGELFTVLVDQSTQRTGMQHGLKRSLEHFVSFPFEWIYHFAPWTLLGITLIRKGSLQRIGRHPFLRYCGVIFLANVSVYWLSPGVFARYFFMMVPLVLMIFAFFYTQEKEQGSNAWQIRAVEWTFMFFVLAGTFMLPILPLIGVMGRDPLVWLKLMTIWVPLLAISILLLKWKAHRLMLTVLAFLLFRVAFNFFVLPERAAAEARYLDGVRGVARAAEGSPLYIFKNNYLLQEADVFYINQDRGEMLVRKHEGFTTRELYLVDDRQYDPAKFELLYQYACKWYDRPIRVCRIREGADLR
ncbi:MAG TPA: hypothetical protein P5550_04710 [Bacteroidales bacterium]|nr:hypothetical protein [Bacteroidales bacterium]HRZ75806.1 hypothetical protein [Bacteroidales bacterium]